jgi:hypothetical protein
VVEVQPAGWRQQIRAAPSGGRPAEAGWLPAVGFSDRIGHVSPVPAASLFVDDREEYISAAQRRGMHRRLFIGATAPREHRRLHPIAMDPREPREFAKTEGFSVGTHGSDSRFSGEEARVHDEPGVRDRLQGSVGAVVPGKGVRGGFGDIGSGAGDA